MKIKKTNRVKTISKKLLLTLGLIFLFQALTYVPTPFVSQKFLNQMSQTGSLDIFQLLGRSFKEYTLMAFGISSYISASMIMMFVPMISKTAYDIFHSPGGQNKMKRWTIGLGVFISILTSIVTTIYQHFSLNLFEGTNPWLIVPLVAIWHAVGTGIAIWIGETITNKGYGNGTSLLLTANILGSLPDTIHLIQASPKWVYSYLLIFSMVVIVTFFEGAMASLPLIYSKSLARGVNRFSELSASSSFPIKVNLSGMMAIILSQSFVQMIHFVSSLVKGNQIAQTIEDATNDSNTLVYSCLLAIFIIFANKLYASLSFDAQEISDNLQKAQGLVSGVNPSQETTETLQRTANRLSFVSTVYIVTLVIGSTLVAYYGGLTLGLLSATSIIIIMNTGSEIMLQLGNDLILGSFSMSNPKSKGKSHHVKSI